MDATAAEPSIPTCIQGSQAPMFHGEGADRLKCQCGHVLIEGYKPRQYAGIGFECVNCKSLTLSESWPIGEPLPRTIVTLGRSGRFLLGSTVDVKGKAGFTCDQEIERVGRETKVRPPANVPFDLSLDALQQLESEINLLSAGELDKAIRSAERAHASGNVNFLNSPPAWAICHMKSCVESATINLDDERTLAALTFLQLAKHLIERWEHHPLFALMSKALVLEYPHAITQLIAAAYLSEHGNPIGFNDPARFEGQSPDLFINANVFETISLEVKAPRELQWPNPCPSLSTMETLLVKQLQKASKQITGELGGVVIIGTSWASREGEQVFQQALENLDKRKKISSRIAGVVGVCLNISGHYYFPAGKPLTSNIAAHTSVHLNSRFSGQQFINT